MAGPVAEKMAQNRSGGAEVAYTSVHVVHISIGKTGRMYTIVNMGSVVYVNPVYVWRYGNGRIPLKTRTLLSFRIPLTGCTLDPCTLYA